MTAERIVRTFWEIPPEVIYGNDDLRRGADCRSRARWRRLYAQHRPLAAIAWIGIEDDVATGEERLP